MTVIGLNAIIHKRIESTQKFVPLTPSVTSYGMGWKTLQAVHYRGSAASGEFSLPPVPRHKLFLIIRPSERLELRSEGVRLNRPPAAGSIHVIPAGSSVRWCREENRDALLIDLEPSLIARCAGSGPPANEFELTVLPLRRVLASWRRASAAIATRSGAGSSVPIR